MSPDGREWTRCATAAGLAALVYLLGAAPARAAQPSDVTMLMDLLARVERVEASYRETVESALIDTALGSRGELVYESPDRIRRVDERGDGFQLDGERLGLIADGEVVEQLAVSDIGPLKAMAGALRAVFAGDVAALRADYRLDYRTAADRWTLRLAPRSGAGTVGIREIEIAGDGARIARIVMLAANGDRRTLAMQLLSREPARLD